MDPEDRLRGLWMCLSHPLGALEATAAHGTPSQTWRTLSKQGSRVHVGSASLPMKPAVGLWLPH
jgi:hypothetical protein